MADPGLRGFLLVFSFASYCLGILMVYVLGASFNWDIVAFSGLVLPILAFIAFCLVPESPAWLVRRRKNEEAKKALLWLRGGDVDQVTRKAYVFQDHKTINELNIDATIALIKAKLFFIN